MDTYLEITLLMSNILKLSKCSIEISEDLMFLDKKLPRSDACHVKT